MSAADRRSEDGSVLTSAVAGATLAAVVVGLCEATVVGLERQLGIEISLLFFALLFYGVVGVAVGLAAGVGLAVLGRTAGGRRAFALSGAATLSVLLTVITRFRVFRDVLHETFEGQPISPALFNLATVVGAVVLFALGYLAWRAVARQRLASPVFVLGGVALALGASWLAMGLERTPAAPPPSPVGRPVPTGPSVILVLVDTLRADHLSCYGYPANRTPAIDALAQDGTLFTRTFAQASWTRPSVATILTSLYPSSHRAIHKSDVLPASVLTLAEVMQATGYRTIGFANNINVAPLFNFQQGFDEYVFLEPAFFFGASEAAAQLTIYNQLRLMRERYFSHVKHVENYYQPADVVTDHGLDWIARNGDRPFFMMLHYMDPHDPYFAHPWNGEAFARVANPNPERGLADRYRSAYDGEISYLDGQLERLFKGLKARGVYDRTVIVLTSDHGEEFCDHGGWWHGTTLYDEQIAVPLIVKPPAGGLAGVVNEGLASSVDIAPTMLAIAGIAVPETMVGKPLGLIGTAPPPRDHSFAESALEGNILQSYRTDTWKLIHANPGNPRGLPESQLFEVANDPGEQRDVFSGRPQEAGALASGMAAVRQRAEAVAAHASETAIDSATEERLRALGYVH